MPPIVRLLEKDLDLLESDINKFKNQEGKDLSRQIKLLRKKSARFEELGNLIRKLPSNEADSAYDLLDRLNKLRTDFDEIMVNLEEQNESKTQKTPSPHETPTKKKSKVEEFIEAIEGKGRDIIIAEATSIITELEKDNEHEKRKRDRLQKPLTCRCYMDKIEDICGGALPFLPDSEVKGKKPREVEILKRAALWRSYFKNNKDSPYIRDFLADLKKEYDEFVKCHSTITFEKYLDECAYAIGTAHRQVSERISHGLDGTARKIKELKKFDKQTDRFLTIFYNSVIGQDLSDCDSD